MRHFPIKCLNTLLNYSFYNYCIFSMKWHSSWCFFTHLLKLYCMWYPLQYVCKCYYLSFDYSGFPTLRLFDFSILTLPDLLFIKTGKGLFSTGMSIYHTTDILLIYRYYIVHRPLPPSLFYFNYMTGYFYFPLSYISVEIL